MILKQPFGSESFVAVTDTRERFRVAELHVRKFLETSCKRLAAVSTTVQQILVEDFRMLVADVIGKKSNVLGALETAIVHRTKYGGGVEK